MHSGTIQSVMLANLTFEFGRYETWVSINHREGLQGKREVYSWSITVFLLAMQLSTNRRQFLLLIFRVRKLHRLSSNRLPWIPLYGLKAKQQLSKERRHNIRCGGLNGWWLRGFAYNTLGFFAAIVQKAYNGGTLQQGEVRKSSTEILVDGIQCYSN